MTMGLSFRQPSFEQDEMTNRSMRLRGGRTDDDDDGEESKSRSE